MSSVSCSVRRALRLWTVVGLSVCLIGSTAAIAGERVTNGNFGSSTGWTNWTERGSITRDFNSSTGGPSGGSTPHLRYHSGSNFNGGVWQAVTLVGGGTYTLSGVFRDANGSDTWAEVLIGTSAPVNAADYGNGLMVKSDTWSCDNWNHAFSSGCVNNTTTYVCSGSGNQTRYLVLKVGMGGSIDTTFDSVSLVGPDPCIPPSTPGAPVVSNPTTSSLDVANNAGDSGTAYFAFRINGGAFTNQYVQANGSVGGSAVYQQKATWGTKTVTGLVSGTTYTFDVIAATDGSGSCTSSFGTSANGTTSGSPCPVTITNPGFENGTTGWGYNKTSGINEDGFCGASHSGSGYALAGITNLNGSAQAIYYQVVDVIAGHTYTISAWAKIANSDLGGNGTIGDDKFELRVHQGDATGISAANVNSGSYSSTQLGPDVVNNSPSNCGNYVQVSGSVTASTNKLTIIGFGSFVGTGSCCWNQNFNMDDVEMVDNTVSPPTNPTVSGPTPASQTVCEGGSASITVSPDAGSYSGVLTYQWRKGTTNLSNGGNISGATSATLTINPVGAGDAASDYNCVVTSGCGSVTSGNASVSLNAATQITTHPSNQTGCGNSVQFTVAATGTGTLSYQWRKGTTNLSNVGNISGADTATLTINPVGVADAATNYNCVVTGSCGSATSNNATLTVPDDDSDGVCNDLDDCPNDPNKTDPGICGCGVPDTDSDSDGTPDCIDECDADPDKIEPGICGCGTPDTDTDNDGTPDCNDACPNDPDKTAPGICGCGVADTDSDGDSVADCLDGCPSDPDKTDPGICGCGVADDDSDNDGTPDCNDDCPNDPGKIDPGQCGCGTADTDTDGDGIADCNDPDDDNDGVEDGLDSNPLNPFVCEDADGDGCDDCSVGVDGFGPLPDNDPNNDGTDTDGDGICDAGDPDSDNDGVPDGLDPAPLNPSICGDSDSDGCDDCSVGVDGFGPLPDNDPNNDGTDTDGDGLCDFGDPDDDNDNVPDGDDSAPLDPFICRDLDNDTCDDCSSGVDDPANDGPDADGDGICDAGDNCVNNSDPDQTDSDGDGNGDPCDICPGFDDNIDTDGDLTPDGCDECPTDPNKILAGVCGCGVPENPTVILTDPMDDTVLDGQSALFSVSASGENLTYQWQLDSGSGFADIPGAESSSYTTPALTLADDGNQYRCVVTGDCGVETSAAATADVDPIAVITLTPDDTCLSSAEPTLTVTIDLSQASDVIVGGQFFMDYDNSVLDFVSADPGNPPFVVQVYESVNEAAGTIDYAVGVNGGGPGTMSDTTMAVLTFTVIGDACDMSELVAFRTHEPPTRLTNDTAENLPPVENNMASITLDHTPPVLTIPADATIECDESSDPSNTGQATATDNCDAAPVVTYTDSVAAGACAQDSIITRTWKAEDACGNVTTLDQIITIEDTTAPVISGVPGDVTVECDAVPAPASPTVTDNCDPSPLLTYGEVRTDGACLDSYTLTRTWTATDACGNQSQETQVITVQDTTPPVITGVPADETVECDAVPAPASPTATDNCDTSVDLVYNEVRTDGPCDDTYTLTRTWTATDNCGNQSQEVQVITVQDTTPPVITGVPADETVECDAVPAPASPTATDNCDTDVDLVYDEVRTDGPCDDTYTLTRTWTATDNCGNQSQEVQVITVQDTTPPVITGVPADETVECDAVPAPASPTATDNCDTTVDLVYDEVRTDGPCDDTYTLTRTWTATDNCGNQAQEVQVITVQDTTAPTFACPSDIVVSADAGLCTASLTITPPIATDNCDLSPVVEGVRSDALPLTDPYPSGQVTTITWTATDGCGNMSQCDQTVTVNAVNELVVSVQLSPTLETGPITRCITFELWNCTTSSKVVVNEVISFTGGLASNVTVEVPCGAYDCITARDKLHTLRSTDSDDFAIFGTQYVADFTGDPNLGGDWLVGGNLNDDQYIDILDFGALVGQFNQNYGTPDTTCTTAPFHADVSGDGIVGSADFTFIQQNFLSWHQPNCCGAGILEGGSLFVRVPDVTGDGECNFIDVAAARSKVGEDPAKPGNQWYDVNGDGIINFIDVSLVKSMAGTSGYPIRKISVAELENRGLAELAQADLNGDGFLSTEDMEAFAAGARP